MKSKLTFVICLLFITNYLYAQREVKDYVKQNVTEIKHLNIEDSTFDDLELFGEAVGSAKIVALGEQMHGDGTTFMAKGRLIKYLHEKKGFNVVVFESDFYGLTYGFEQVEKSKDSINKFITRNVAGMWSWCNFASPFLYNYIYKTYATSKPLILAGIDCQLQSPYTFSNLSHKLKSVTLMIARTKEDSINSSIVVETLPSIYFNKQQSNPLACKKGLLAINRILISEYLSLLNSEEINILQNIKAAYENILPLLEKRKFGKDYAVRDTQMYNNLMWLVTQKYPNEKFILWAHNAHIAKSINQFADKKSPGIMLGHLLANKAFNSPSYYAVGFTSYNATSKWTTESAYNTLAEKPLKASFENWINKSWEYAFIDWSKLNYNGSFSMKGSLEYGQHRNFNYPWHKAYDGTFFIRNIEGCSVIE